MKGLDDLVDRETEEKANLRQAQRLSLAAPENLQDNIERYIFITGKDRELKKAKLKAKRRHDNEDIMKDANWNHDELMHAIEAGSNALGSSNRKAVVYFNQ